VYGIATENDKKNNMCALKVRQEFFKKWTPSTLAHNCMNGEDCLYPYRTGCWCYDTLGAFNCQELLGFMFDTIEFSKISNDSIVYIKKETKPIDWSDRDDINDVLCYLEVKQMSIQSMHEDDIDKTRDYAIFITRLITLAKQRLAYIESMEVLGEMASKRAIHYDYIIPLDRNQIEKCGNLQKIILDGKLQ
jgi:hypothetical protein